MGRELIYFPIVHTAADMGGWRDRVERLKAGRLGRQGAAQSARAADRLWTDIERAAAGLECRRARVYQDGLPECGRELELVEELARAGSRNHRLLLELRARGAVIMGTEAAGLVVREYQRATAALAAADRGRKPVQDELLAARDRHIAARINATLAAGETGILFLGMAHDVTPLLDRDIRVRFPLRRPALAGAKR